MREAKREPGPYLITFTGRKVYPLTLKAEDIHIFDIAHALSYMCRYNGHALFFYSVAQHCVLLAESKFPGIPLWKLMHDAGEAYLPDVTCGFKPLLPKLVEAENHILEKVAEVFDLPPLCGKVWEDVKIGDNEITYWEGKALMPEFPGTQWSRDVKPPKVEVKIEYWPPRYAEERFIKCFRKLFGFSFTDQELKRANISTGQ